MRLVDPDGGLSAAAVVLTAALSAVALEAPVEFDRLVRHGDPLGLLMAWLIDASEQGGAAVDEWLRIAATDAPSPRARAAGDA